MNQVMIFSMSFLLCISLQAQKVTITTQSEKVKGESVEGYGTELEARKDAVVNAWVKFLKDIGKVKQGSDPMTITEPVFNGLTFSKGTIYSTTREKGENTYLWLGIKAGDWETNDVNRINNELEKAVYQFGVKYYRDKIQAQIDEAQQAFDAVEKQKQRITNQTKDLTIQLSNNEQEKVQLDKSLEANKFENAVLKVKIFNNTKAQDSLAVAGVQIQKVKQMHLERQRKVN